MLTSLEMGQATEVVFLVNLSGHHGPPRRFFLEASERTRLPFLLAGNNRDLVNQGSAPGSQRGLSRGGQVISLLPGENVSDVVAEIASQ